MGLAQFLVTQTGIDVVNGKNDVKKVWKSPFFKMGQFFLKSAPNLLLISRISARNSKMATWLHKSIDYMANDQPKKY